MDDDENGIWRMLGFCFLWGRERKGGRGDVVSTQLMGGWKWTILKGVYGGLDVVDALIVALRAEPRFNSAIFCSHPRLRPLQQAEKQLCHQ